MNTDTGGQRCETTSREDDRFRRRSRLEVDGDRASASTADKGTPGNDLLDNAYEDYLQQIGCGEHVDTSEFCERYPEVESELRRLLAVDGVFGDKESLLLGCFDRLWPHIGEECAGFELVKELGRGAFARVFLAHETKLGDRDVALKVGRCGAHEAWVLGKLKHRNIVPVHGVYDDEHLGLNAICMPYLGNVTLRDSISRTWQNGRPRCRISSTVSDVPQVATHDETLGFALRRPSQRTYLEETLRIGFQIAEALEYAHSAGVCQLDLKPANILLDESCSPRLLDFNLSFEQSHGIPRVGGTLAYMAPEQAKFFLEDGGETRLDERCDVYSLGVILFEMLYGKLPFGRVSQSLSSRTAAEELLARQRSWNPVESRADAVDSRVSAIIEKCLAFDPQDRYQTAADLARDLKRELSFHRRAERWCRLHRSQLAAFAGVVALLSAGWALHIANRDPYPTREYRIGVSHLKVQEYQDAIDHFSRSLKVDPKQTFVLAARGEAYLNLECYHDAIRDFKAAGEIGKTGRQLALFAYCCNRVNSHPETITMYQEAMDLGFVSTAVLNNCGFAYHLTRRDDEAIEMLDAAVERGDHLMTTLYNRSCVWRAIAVKESREPVEAMRDIEAAISDGACSSDVYYCAASIYIIASAFRESMRTKAREYCDQALKHGIPRKTIQSDIFLAPLYKGGVPQSSPVLPDNRNTSLSSHFLRPN